MKKRWVSFLVVICTILMFGTTKEVIFAIDEKAFLTPFIDKWIEEEYNNSVEVNEIIPVVDGYGKTTGYSISFMRGNEPAGYVIIDTDKEKAILEYSYDGRDPYAAMEEQVENIYYRDIAADKPILLFVQGYDEEGDKTGHFAVVFGYKITTDGSKYLTIANCWDNSSQRYIRFKSDGLTAFDGYAIQIGNVF